MGDKIASDWPDSQHNNSSHPAKAILSPMKMAGNWLYHLSLNKYIDRSKAESTDLKLDEQLSQLIKIRSTYKKLDQQIKC